MSNRVVDFMQQYQNSRKYCRWSFSVDGNGEKSVELAMCSILTLHKGGLFEEFCVFVLKCKSSMYVIKVEQYQIGGTTIQNILFLVYKSFNESLSDLHFSQLKLS